MLDVLTEVIAPVLAVAVIGGIVCRRLGIAPPVISALSFNLFSPALVFDSMSTIALDGSDTARIAAVAGLGAVVLAALAWGLAVALGLDRATRAAVTLAASISNGGNLGLPVVALAFGTAGFDVAIVAFVTGAVAANSLGVLVAAMAGGSVAGGLRRLVGVPSLWAAVGGLSVNGADVSLPAVVQESAATLGAAAIPVMLVVLGTQLRLDRSTDGLGALATAVGLRLVGGPATAWLLATATGLDGLARDVLVVLGGMPTAVYTTIVATQYGARPALVTRVVVVSTLASVLTLTVLISAYR